jgi:hypothetical protein
MFSRLEPIVRRGTEFSQRNTCTKEIRTELPPGRSGAKVHLEAISGKLIDLEMAPGVH